MLEMARNKGTSAVRLTPFAVREGEDDDPGHLLSRSSGSSPAILSAVAVSGTISWNADCDCNQ
jgi:hypothetical protein